MAPPPDPIASLRAALRGHYEFERELGQGAFATVYLARDLKHERKVAIKVLHADPNSELGELRFIREIRMLARLQHPNILPLHDSGHVEALLYYVMPYVAGETLRDRINRERRIAWQTACNLTRDVADALSYAHAQGIIHRDIKPENILLSAGHPIIADFGIARAIDVGGVRQLTQTGSGSPGTPAYMSPEQLLGDREVDSRSDIYSLGCVLYEMIAGRHPFAGKEGFVKRFTEAPPALRSIRPDAPEWLDAAIARSLSRDPNDRFPDAGQMALAMTATATQGGVSSATESPAPLSGSGARKAATATAAFDREDIASRLKHWGRLAWARRIPIIVAAAVLTFAALAVRTGVAARVARSVGGKTTLDATAIAVLPFLADSAVNQRVASSAVQSALERWAGMNLIPDEEVSAAITSAGRVPLTRSQAANIAAKLGAAWFIWGQVPANGSATIQLFDTQKARPLKTESFALDSVNALAVWPVLLRLLRVANRPPAADGGDAGTTVYPAWVAYGLGHVALTAWNLGEAERQFRVAVARDPSYGAAHLWLSQVLYWKRREPATDWAEHLPGAIRASNALSARDLNIARALASMNERNYPQACGNYQNLVRADSVDFVGWWGLGECESWDNRVVPSSSTPSRWQFRAGWYSAALNYMRALRIEPGAHSIVAFDRLQTLLPTAKTRIRFGRDAQRKLFVAYPSLIGDTIAFVPYPSKEFSTLSGDRLGRRQEALDRSAALLLAFAGDWTTTEPSNASAYEALAAAREIRGEIVQTSPNEMGAIEAIRTAENLTRDPDQRFRLEIRDVWLRFKKSDYVGARTLADSLLAATTPTGEQAGPLLGIAALTGKIGKTAQLANTTGAFITSELIPPPGARETAAQLFAFGIAGACGDSVDALTRRLGEQVSSFVAGPDQARMRQDLTSRPMSMLAPCSDGRSALAVQAAGDPLLETETAYARRNESRLRVLLDSLGRDMSTQRVGDFALDYTFALAWVRAASGDTAGAISQLDRVLGALPAFHPSSIEEPGAAAAAGRAMALRADLAAAKGDVVTAKRWGRATATLWASADAPLQPVVERMRTLAGISK